MGRVGFVLLYLVVGGSGLGLAFFISSLWVPSSYSQSPPPEVPEDPNEPRALPDSAPAPSSPTYSSAVPSNIAPQPDGAGSQPSPNRQAQPDIPPPPTNTAPGPDPNIGETVEEDIAAFLQPFIYRADNRRDPFEPYSEVKPSGDGNMSMVRLPLQRFDIDDIRLIGIIWDVENPRAMFLDPSKAVHVLGKDDRIGRSNGYIAVIREGEVVVVEPVTIRGELAYSTRIMKITR